MKFIKQNVILLNNTKDRTLTIKFITDKNTSLELVSVTKGICSYTINEDYNRELYIIPINMNLNPFIEYNTTKEIKSSFIDIIVKNNNYYNELKEHYPDKISSLILPLYIAESVIYTITYNNCIRMYNILSRSGNSNIRYLAELLKEIINYNE